LAKVEVRSEIAGNVWLVEVEAGATVAEDDVVAEGDLIAILEG